MEAAPRTALCDLQPGFVETLSEYVRQSRADAGALVRDGSGGAAVARKLAAAYDGLLSSVWVASDAMVRSAGIRGRAALVALGGFGRGRLALHSDMDLLVLGEPCGADYASRMAEAILYPLWDVGLEVGHAVRTIDETVALAGGDLKTATTLLDVRWIAGDRTLCDGLSRSAASALGGPRLSDTLDRLRTDAARRHERFGGELHLLEPEVKSGRGGLRDLDVALWAARLCRRVDCLGDLPKVGLLSSREWEGVAAADDFLWRARNLLHARAGRRSDRLTFEDQAEIALRLGFGDDEHAAAPRFMQAYYRHAEAIARAMSAVLERAEPPTRHPAPRERDLGGGVKLHGEAVSVTDAGVFRGDPACLVRLFRVAAERGAPIYPFARDLAAKEVRDSSIAAALLADASAPRELLDLLAASASRSDGSALMELHQAGVLAAILPEMAPLTGLVQHDVYHVYTVDVHSIRAVARLHEMRRGDHGAKLHHLAGSEPKLELLSLAVLLHDVGKGRGDDHSRRGAGLANDVARRLGLSEADRSDLVFLVREHLALYRAAMQRDIDDPGLAGEVARRVGTPERLDRLYLLTLADLGTTGPTVLTTWKAAMLEDLYRRVREHLEGVVPDRRAESVRASVREAWPGGSAEAPAVLETLPDEYLVRHDVASIVRHIGAISSREKAPGVSASPMTEDTAEVQVTAEDRPGLLSLIACALAANRLHVLSAEIHSRIDGHVLDVFRVRGGDGLATRLESTVARACSDLRDLVAGTTPPEELLASRRPPPTLREHRLPPVRTKVEVVNDHSVAYTIVDVYTRDTPLVLYRVARVLGELGLSVARARVATEGHRVADSFYVTRVAGGKVVADEEIQAIRNRLVRALAT